VHGLASGFKDNISSCEALEAVCAGHGTGRRNSDTGNSHSGSGGRVCECVYGVVLFLVVAHAVTCVLLGAILLGTTVGNRNCAGAEATMSSNYKVMHFLRF
jgi:hypothetical protein